MKSIKITSRTIQIVLGLLWLLDGLLQLQPRMFTSDFASRVIAPAALGQPRIVNGVMHLFIHIFLTHPAIFNSLVAITQVSLGVLILFKKTAKLGLSLSVAWGLFVWYVGEGLGGLLSSHTLLLMGAPGAALIYVVVALAVLPGKNKHIEAKAPDRPAYWLAAVWAILWLVGAIYQLLPGQNSVGSLGSMISANSVGAPGWLASVDNRTANFLYHIGTKTPQISSMHMTTTQMANMQSNISTGYWFIIVLVLVQAAIGLAVFLPGHIHKITIGLGILVSLSFWVVGQSFGGLYTGLATDPNSAPLFILLGVAIIGAERFDFHKLRQDLLNIFKRIENLAT